MAADAGAALLLVVGSVNADIYIELERLPLKGETISAKDDSGFMLPGGKGANQAVAAARMQGGARIICNFGSDGHGATLRDAVSSAGVDTSLCTRVDKPSGQAFILLQADGDNSIILTAGSNAAWPQQLPLHCASAIASCSILLLQREIPERVNIEAARIAHGAGRRVVLDAGGSDKELSEAIFPFLAVFSPNETELQRVAGMPTQTREQVVAAARKLIGKGVHNVLVKLGARGSLMVTREGEVIEQTAFPPDKLVDTTGAGDAFTAGFAVGLAEGLAFRQAMELGAAAATLAIGVKGAMPSMPHRAAVEGLLKRLGRR